MNTTSQSRKIRLCLAALTFCAGSAKADLETSQCLLSPFRSAELVTASAGLVAEIRVQAGDQVRAGDVIAELDNARETASVAIARNNAEDRSMLEAVDQLRQAELERLERARSLHERALISDDALQERELAYIQREIDSERVRADLRRAALQLALAEAELEATQLRAPFSGIVTERYLQPGEYAAQSTPLARLVQVDTLRVEIIVSQGDLDMLQAADAAVVIPELAPDLQARATHILIDPVIDPASSTLRVRLEIANPEGRIVSGQRCRVIFQ